MKQSARTIVAVMALASGIAGCEQLSAPSDPARSQASPTVRTSTSTPACVNGSPQASEGNPFGIHVPAGIGAQPLASASAMQAVQQANIGWVRLGIQWSSVKDTASNWDSSVEQPIQALVAAVQSARDNCLNVLVNITYQTNETQNGGYPNETWRRPVPSAYARWQRFVNRVVQATSPTGVTYYSLGNENNTLAFTSPHAGWDVVYDTLYRRAASEIRSLVPGSKLVALELAWNSSDTAEARGLVQRLLNDGLVDVVALHHYNTLSDVVDNVMLTQMHTIVPRYTEVRPGELLPVWLTETGPGGLAGDAAGPDDGYRDDIAALIGRFVHVNLFGLDLPAGKQQYPNWQKTFVFRLYAPTGENMDRGLGAFVGNTFVPRRSFWAYRYLAETWAQFKSVSSAGHVQGQGWSQGIDHYQYAGTTGQGWPLTGMLINQLPSSMRNAGTDLCYRAAFNWVPGWTPDNGTFFCGGENAGPYEWVNGNGTMALEAFELQLNNPFFGWNGLPMQACGKPHLANIGWVTPPQPMAECTPASVGGGRATIGRRGLSDRIEAFYIFLEGDLR